MKDHLKIAIYSGDIPSTTFIERLVEGLSHKTCEIYLFGFLKRNVDYNSRVSVFAYKNTKTRKAVYLLKYSLLLFFLKNKDKQKLDAILKLQSKSLMLDKVKCYPVLWHRPDVFHLQWAKGLKDWIWVQEFGIKLVLSLRGAHINYSPIADGELASMYREYFPKVDAFHAVSEAIGKEAETYGAAKEKITVVYSGLALHERPKLHKNQNKIFQIISVGRPHWVKGYTYALDACKLLKDQGFDFHYTIVGGAGEIEFAYQVHDLKLTEVVTLLNQLPYQNVQELIHQADLLVLSSVKEGVANVVLEALSLETLIVSTDCGGITEVIKDNENGFIVPNRDAERLAKKIIAIANLEEVEKEKVRKNALQTLINNHSEAQMVDEMFALYKRVIDV